MRKNKKHASSFIYQRTSEEVWQELIEQFNALHEFGVMYDQGKLWAAKHLASVIYTLVQDNPRNPEIQPILIQLGLREKILFLNTSRGIHSPIKPNTPLAYIDLRGDKCTFGPMCQADPIPECSKKVGFIAWWGERIIEDATGRAINRHTLVNRIRSKDGGSHFDASINDEDYLAIKKDADSRFRWTVNGISTPVPNAHLASLRQIAWELELTLKDIINPVPPSFRYF